MVTGYSLAVETGDSFMYLLWEKVLWRTENKLFQHLKNVLFWGTLSKSQGGKHNDGSYFTCYLTAHTNWKRFWVKFSSEKVGILFCEAFLSNAHCCILQELFLGSLFQVVG